MHRQWSYFVALVLLAIAKGSTAYPSGRDEDPPAKVTPSTEVSKDALVAACPHTVTRLATDEELSGTWYGLEILEDVLERKDGDKCWEISNTVAENRLIMDKKLFQEGVVNGSSSHSLSRIADNIWENDGRLFDERSIFGISSESSLLVFCQIDTGILSSVRTILLGRNPQTTEQQLQLTHGPQAATKKRFLFNLQNCAAPSSS